MNNPKCRPRHIATRRSQYLPPLPDNYRLIHGTELEITDNCELLKSESKFILMVNHSPKLIGLHQRLPKMEYSPFAVRRKSNEPKKLVIEVPFPKEVFQCDEKQVSKTPEVLDVTFGFNY
jgi:hypothetical protein